MKKQCEFVIRQATIADLDSIVPLFDAYRKFYRKPGDLVLARQFLLERFQHNESTIFIAIDGEGSAIGFTQLFPSFSSASAARIFILNDLFVSARVRRTGIAKSLLRVAKDFGQMMGAVRLTLSTEVTNTAAQTLYKAEGWVRQVDFYSYDLQLQPASCGGGSVVQG
jgi:GNAT superfamily N-acetyltransferase